LGLYLPFTSPWHNEEVSLRVATDADPGEEMIFQMRTVSQSILFADAGRMGQLSGGGYRDIHQFYHITNLQSGYCPVRRRQPGCSGAMPTARRAT
jgi:hypothetical protein